MQKKAYRPNFLSGSDFFPPRPPFPRPRPPRPRPRPLTDSFLNGTKSFALTPSSPPLFPLTGAILGKRYLGTYFICDWTRVGCNGLSWRIYSRSRGLSSKWAWNKIQMNSVRELSQRRSTLSLSEFKISVFSSFILASQIAALVTLLNASSIRYLNDSTCFISNLYSLILLPLAPCSFSILVNTCSSFSAVSALSNYFILSPKWVGNNKGHWHPRTPRPGRSSYSVGDEVGRSKLSTQETSTKSTPRVTPYSLSPPFRFRFRDFPGGGGEWYFRFRDFDVEGLGSKTVSVCIGSLCVIVTESNHRSDRYSHQKIEWYWHSFCSCSSGSSTSSSSSSSSWSCSPWAPLSSVAMI